LILFWSVTEGRENPFEGFSKAKEPFFYTSSLLTLSDKKSKDDYITLKTDQNITKQKNEKKVKFGKSIPNQDNRLYYNTEPTPTLAELSKKYILIDCCKEKRVHNNKIKQKKRVISRKKFSAYKKEIYSNCSLQIYQYNNIIKLITKDCLKSKMILNNPKRVVFDFYKKIKIKPKSFRINNSKIKRITIASHSNYYRITIYPKKPDIHIKRDRASFFIIY
jgi:hypothetical protein